MSRREEIAKLLLKSERDVEWGHSGTVDDESWRGVVRHYLSVASQILELFPKGDKEGLLTPEEIAEEFNRMGFTVGRTGRGYFDIDINSDMIIAAEAQKALTLRLEAEKREVAVKRGLSRLNTCINEAIQSIHRGDNSGALRWLEVEALKPSQEPEK